MAETGTSTIGPYRITRQLGRGAMGVVHLAREASLNRDVALKVLSPELANDPTFVERFRREAQSAAGLSHPNIVQIYALSESNQTTCFAMEFVEGRDLRSTLTEEGGLGWRTSLEIVLQIAKALDNAHSKGVIHRDIKPGNIMVEQGTGRIVVTDFGLSRVLKGSRLTREGEVLGTPEYMSPEQVEGKDVDGRSDLYSLGVVLFELLTGTVPFDAENALAVLRKHLEESPPLANDLTPSVPEEVARLCDQLLEKDPNHRLQSAAEIVKTIERMLSANSATVLTLKGQPKPRRRSTHPAVVPRIIWASAGGILVLLGLLVGAFVATNISSRRPMDPRGFSFEKAFTSAQRLEAKGHLTEALAKYWAIAALCEDEEAKAMATAGARACLSDIIQGSKISFPELLMESGLFTQDELSVIFDLAQAGDVATAVKSGLKALVEKGLLSEEEAEALASEDRLTFPQKWRRRVLLSPHRPRKGEQETVERQGVTNEEGP